MKEKVKAKTDLAPTTNIAEARYMIGLIDNYRKFFPILSDMMLLLNEITRKNVSLKWTKQCQKSLNFIKLVITTRPILAYLDPDKQYYLFVDSGKHSWSGIFEASQNYFYKIKIVMGILITMFRRKT